MFYREHGVPHFHAVYGGHDISVEVETGRIHGQFRRAVVERMHKLRAATVVVAMLTWSAAADAQSPPASAPFEPRDADVAVYQAALSHASVRGTNPKRPRLVVVQEMSPERSQLQVGERSADDFRRFVRAPNLALITQFLCLSQGRSVVPRAVADAPGILLLSEQALSRALEGPGRDYWREFGRRFPKAAGIVGLSPVAYSLDGTEAMVHVAIARGLLNAHGQAMVLRLAAGAWQVVDHIHTWES